MKCYGCGRNGFTIRTCPNCSKKGPANKTGDGRNKQVGQDKKDQRKQDGKSFAQVNDKKKTKDKNKQRNTEQYTELGLFN